MRNEAEVEAITHDMISSERKCRQEVQRGKDLQEDMFRDRRKPDWEGWC